MRTPKLPFLLGLVVLALPTLAGCKAQSCEEVCERQSGCEGVPEVSDCASACATEAETAENAGCTDERDARLSCHGTIDSCTSNTLCAGQDAAYLACITEACQADPTKCAPN